MHPIPAEVLELLTAGAESADRSPDWPQASWHALRSTGVLARSVPREYGGAGYSAADGLVVSEALASACLTTAFILSQREAAVRQLLKGPPHLKVRYLPGLASGDQFLTIGLSQLTTSRQHQGAALRAHRIPDGGIVLDGAVPWVTGADQATAVVVGATLPDATQVLVVLPTDRPGTTIEPPMPLAALTGSRTSSIRCNGVTLEAELLLAGPSEHVLGTVGGGGLETSALALGVATAATGILRHEAVGRPWFANGADHFESRLAAARLQLQSLIGSSHSDAVLALRVECTRLALQTTQAALLASKGTGFISPHAVQRWARQALFFLVWSCPRPVADGVLDSLLPQV